MLACAFLAFTAAAQPAVSSNRFLFIIDTSASMKPFDNAVRETVFDLVYSGARGQMTNGDTYGIWLIGEQNNTSFAMDVWKSRHAVEMGARATVHVKDQGFRGRARLDVALADALRVVRNVEDLTLILVSNGETPIAGTPFDAEINARFRELAPQMKRAKKTLNTALVAQGGAVVAWAVNAPEYLIDVPYVAPKPKPAKVEVALQTNGPAPIIPVTAKAKPALIPKQPPVPVAPPPNRSVAPIVITKETVAHEKLEYQAMTAAASIPETAAPVPTNAKATTPPEAKTAVSISSNPPVAGPTNAVALVTNKVPVHTMLTNTSTSSVVVAPKAETTNSATESVVAVPPTDLSVPKPVLPPATAENSIHPLVWTGLGAMAAVICVLAGTLFVRSRRHEPSLISQAIAQERLSRP